jgi:transposase
MLKPGLGRTHRAYLWSYGSTQFDPMAAVVYDFADGRSSKPAQAFLNGWSGKLVCDDYSGYKPLFGRDVIEVGCLAHARRKFHELHEKGRARTTADSPRQSYRRAPATSLAANCFGYLTCRQSRVRPPRKM